MQAENVIALRTLSDWRTWGQRWRDHAARCETLLFLATAQRDASETLLAAAEAEIARLHALIK